MESPSLLTKNKKDLLQNRNRFRLVAILNNLNKCYDVLKKNMYEKKTIHVQRHWRIQENSSQQYRNTNEIYKKKVSLP